MSRRYFPSCNCEHCAAARLEAALELPRKPIDCRSTFSPAPERSYAPEWRNVYVHPALLADGDMGPALALAQRLGRRALVTDGGRFVQLRYRRRPDDFPPAGFYIQPTPAGGITPRRPTQRRGVFFGMSRTITLTSGQLRALKRLEASRKDWLYVYHYWGAEASCFHDYGVPCLRSTAVALMYYGLVRYVETGLYALTAAGKDYAREH